MAKTEIAGIQVRMARAALRWSIADLARHAGVGPSTVQAIEATNDVAEISGGLDHTLEHRAAARSASMEAIHKALAGAGVTFLPDDGTGAGIRVKGKTTRSRKQP